MKEKSILAQVKPGNEVFEKYKRKRWFLLAYGVFMMMSVGVCYAWSVLSGPISETFAGWNEALGGLTYTLFIYSYTGFGLLSGILIKKFKQIKVNLFSSAALMFLSFWLTSLANDFLLLYIAFSFLGGMGVAFTYNAIISNVGNWFSDRMGVATGVLLMGYGIGSFVLGNVYTAIKNALDWRMAFLLMGIAIAVIILIGGFIMSTPPEDYEAPVYEPKLDKHPVQTLECTPFEMIKRRSFWFLMFMGCCNMMPGIVIATFGRQLLTFVEPGMLDTYIAIILGLVPIANGLGRVAIGFINDWFGMKFNVRISSTMVFLGAALVFVAFSIASMPFLIIALVLMGFCAGMTAPGAAVVVRKLYGNKNFQINFQVLLCAGLFNSLGTVIFGGLFDAMGGYAIPLLIIAGIAAMGSLISFFINKP